MWNQWGGMTPATPLTAFVTPPLPTTAPPPPPSEPAPQSQSYLNSVPTVMAAPNVAIASALPSTSDPILPVNFNSVAAANPYSQYTPTQYAAMTPEQQYALQQHWQQWQAYQEEYAKWHAQYGEQYTREMQAAAASNPAYADYYQQQLSTSVLAPAPASVPTASSILTATASQVTVTAKTSRSVGQQPPVKITGQPQLYTQPPPSVNLNQQNSNNQSQNLSQASTPTPNPIQYSRPPPIFNVTQPPPSLLLSVSSSNESITRKDCIQNSTNNYECNLNDQRSDDNNKELQCGMNNNRSNSNWTNDNRGSSSSNRNYNVDNDGHDNNMWNNNNNNSNMGFQSNRGNAQHCGDTASNWGNANNGCNNNTWRQRGISWSNSSKQSSLQRNFGPLNTKNTNQRGGGSSGFAKGPYTHQKQPELDEESFDRQFREWEEQFEEWKRANANHPDRAMYRRYEQEFEKQRRRIIERREQMRRRKIQLGKNSIKEEVGSRGGASSSNMNKKNMGDQNSFLSVGNTKSPEHQQQQQQLQPFERNEKFNMGINKSKQKCDNTNVSDEIDENILHHKQQFSDEKLNNSNLLGKRQSSFNAMPSKMRSSDCNRACVIDVDDNDFTNNNDCIDEHKLKSEYDSSPKIAELFREPDGIPGLDLVGVTGSKDNAHNRSDSSQLTQSNDKQNTDIVATTKTTSSNSNVIPDIAKTLSDPEFMKKISEAVAKAQGKDSTLNNNNNGEADNTNRPLSFAEWQRLKCSKGSNNGTGIDSCVNNRSCSTERGNGNWSNNNTMKRSTSSDRKMDFDNTDRNLNGGIDGNGGFNRFGINLSNFCTNQNKFGLQQQFGNNNNNFRGSYNDGNYAPGYGPGHGPGPGIGLGPASDFNFHHPYNNCGRNVRQVGPIDPLFNNFNSGFQNGSNFNANANSGRKISRNSPFNNNNNSNFSGNRRNFGNNHPNFKSMDFNGPNYNGDNNSTFNNNMNNENKSMLNMANTFRCQDGVLSPGFDNDNVGVRGNFNKYNNNNTKNRRDDDSWVKSPAGVNDDENNHCTDDCDKNDASDDYYRNVKIIDYTESTLAPKVIDYGHKPANEFKPMQTIDYGHASRPPQRLLQSRQLYQKQQQQQAKRNTLKKKRKKNKNKTTNSENSNDNKDKSNQEQQQAPISNPISKDQLTNQQITNVKDDCFNVDKDNNDGNKQKPINDKKENNQSDLEEVSDNEYLPDGCIDMDIVDNESDSAAPAPPPPPMLTTTITTSSILVTTAASAKPSVAIFQSTAIANNNVEQNSSKHVQMPLPTVENQNTISIDEILLKPGRLTRPKKICIIIRGPPGSGKSYIAKLIKEKEKEMIDGSNPRILSIDDYFLIENDYEEKCPQTGRKITKKEMLYEYDKKMEDRYMQCLIKTFKKTMSDNLYDFIIIDCNNNSLRSLNEFYCHSKDSGFMPYIIDLYCDLDTCLNRNIHKRCLKDIKEIIDNWKATPFHYIKLDVQTLLENVVEMEDAENVAVDKLEISDITVNNSVSQNNNQGIDTITDNHNNIAVNADDDDSNDDDTSINCEFLKSKWETDNTSEKMARLDGTSKLGIRRKPTMEEYLQIDDWEPPTSNATSSKKRVRWADIEEKRKQEKMREVGFVVGQTDWKRMMDPNAAKRALNKMKYIEPNKKKR